MTLPPDAIVLRAPGALELPEPPEGLRRVTSDQRAELVVLHHDTDDLALHRWGASLSYRDGAWVLRLPVVPSIPDSPAELRWTMGPSSPPAEARGLLVALTGGRPVARVARVVTRRRTHHLLGGDDALLAELHDDEVSVFHGRRMAERFREVVVVPGEDGARSTLEAVRDQLVASGCDEVDRGQRLVRVLGPGALSAPDVPTHALPDRPAASDVVHAAVCDGTRRLLLADPHARLGVDDEGVHQARVAARRLRSDLRTFRDLLDPAWLGDTRHELAWLADALGEVRDADVLTLRLSRALDRLAGADRSAGQVLADRLEAQRDAARTALARAMDSDRHLALLQRLVEACASGPPIVPDRDGPADEVLVALVRGPWRHLRDDVGALDEDPPDEALHRIRIRAKRLRYAAEAAAPALGRPATRLASAAARLQTVLGDHQDACVAEAWLRAAVADLDDPAAAFVTGLLAGRERALADATAVAWRDGWARLDRKKVRGWL